MYEIYGRNNCVWCDRAKELLTAKKETYRFYNIEDDPNILLEFKELFPTAKTVPQILHWKFNGVVHYEADGEWEDEDMIHVGGYEDLVQYLTGWEKPTIGSSTLPTNS